MSTDNTTIANPTAQHDLEVFVAKRGHIELFARTMEERGRARSTIGRRLSSVVDHALACLLGLVGVRISEALNIDIDHLGIEPGHRTVTVLGKGSKLAVSPLPPRVARAVDLAAGERVSGPLLLGWSGERLNREAPPASSCAWQSGRRTTALATTSTATPATSTAFVAGAS